MFIRNELASTNGCSLQLYLPRITHYQLIQAFGEPESGYVDEEKGYDGAEWTFSNDQLSDVDVVYLYFRFNVCRIGAYSQDTARRFLEQTRKDHPELDWTDRYFNIDAP